jgi:exonuclease SbcC
LERAGEVSLDAAARGLRELSGSLQALSAAEAELSRAQSEVDRHRVAAELATQDQGFETIQDARAAVLQDDRVTAAVEQLEEHDRLLREAESVLADPALSDLGEVQPDIEELQRSLADAGRRDADAARAHHLAQESAEMLISQRDRLDDALRAWAPAREAHQTADAMSRLVRGMGADNQLQLRLSSYVLATRLDQVVAAANERLGDMREHRYLLERTSDGARRGAQAGLGLRVVDEWTGEARDPATLSGGETFVVSLALALGLADVVSVESGGVELGTLFIDEGFGMLDLDTLDDVMDRLDALRAGGRTVGVVSHVTELRNRIPTQLHVDKQRNGSSVSVTTLIA